MAAQSGGKTGADVPDNRLALDQFIDRAERSGIAWGLWFDPSKVVPSNRYELRVFTDPVRAVFRGATPTHAASQAMAMFDDYRIGWDE